jgi:hypothetical protein
MNDYGCGKKKQSEADNDCWGNGQTMNTFFLYEIKTVWCNDFIEWLCVVENRVKLTRLVNIVWGEWWNSEEHQCGSTVNGMDKQWWDNSEGV